ncbi:MAG: acyl-CoA desaturase [Cyclobacteriaceae bacterium]|nr:acyl-CoA desaturase [Cyclobacteriaceae bacterium]
MSVTTNNLKTIRFKNQLYKDFSTTLNSRVNEYFKERNLDRYGNWEMVLKTIFMFSLYLIPYGLVVGGVIQQVSLLFLMYFVQGVGMAGIGLSIMHDANHGAYSRSPIVNKILGYSVNIVGGNSTNWKIQHNVLHHTYTNIAGHDEDVSPKPILRFSPRSQKLPIHRFQYIYAWFMYGLMTILWVTIKDFRQLVDYTKSGMLKKQTGVTRAWIWLFVTKLFYYAYTLVIPMMVLPFAWWQIVLSFLLMHYVAGFILGIIFQPAHVMEANEFPMPTEDGTIENNWAVHQLQTTCNFAHKNRIFSWYVGGLNYQIEHHLFPNICHVHYRKLSAIVEKTATEYEIPYKSIRSFREALVLHGRMLYTLGH